MAGPFVANGTQLQVETAPASGTFTQIADMVDFSGPENTAAEVDITNLDDTAGRQYLPGLVDRGNLQCTLHFDPDSAAHQQLFTDQVANPPTVRLYRLVYPTNSPNNDFTSFNAFVQSTSRAGGVDQPATLSLNLRITGAVTEGTLP